MRAISGLKNDAFVFRLISLPNPRHPAGLHGKTPPRINHDLHLVHVTKGDVEFQFKNGGTAVGLPDCVVAIPSYQLYECHQRMRGEIEMLNIHFQIMWNGGQNFQDAWEFPLVFRPKKLEEQVKALRRHTKTWNNEELPLLRKWQAAHGAHELVNFYAQEYARPLREPQTDISMLEARQRIEDSVLKPFHAHRIARETGLSVPQFNRRFRNAFGMSAKQYWQHCVLRLATAKLLEKGGSVKETAYALGFSDPYYFSRWFRRMQGMPPREFRLHNGFML